MRPTFVLAGGSDLAGQLRLLLGALVLLNERALRRQQLPPIYASGVRYVKEPRGVDMWRQAPDVYQLRRGDCEDLAAWRCAELRVSGEDRVAVVDTRQTGVKSWHAFVTRSDGRTEDPSRVLGMRSRSSSAWSTWR